MAKLDLHTLIRSMTMSEKRHFKLFSRRHGGEEESNYIKLFDAISEQESYNSELLEKEDFVNNLAAEKLYLYQSILKSLISYHGSLSSKKKVLEMVSSAEVLFLKGLNTQALNVLEKAEEIAVENELFSHLLVVRELQAEIQSKNFDYAGATEKLSESESTISDLQNLITIQKHTTAAYRDHIQMGNARSSRQKQQLEKHLRERSQSKVNASSRRAELFDMGLELTYVYFISDERKQMQLTKKMTEHYEKHPHLIEYSRIGYISSLHNLINSYREHKQFEKAEEILKRLKALGQQDVYKNSPFIQARIFTYFWNLYFDLLEDKKDIATAKLQLREAEAGIPKHLPYLNKTQHYELLLHMAKISFMSGKRKECIRYTLEIMNDSKFKAREDISTVARIINIIAQFENGNLSTSEYLAQYTRKYLSKNENLFRLEEILLQYIIHFGGKTKKTLDDIMALKELKALRKDEFEAQPFKLFAFDDWMESHVKNMTMEDYYKLQMRSK